MAAKRRIYFTEKQIDEITELYNKGITYNKIISKLNLTCCKDTLVKYLKELNIYKENRKITTSSINSNFEEVLNKWKQGISICKLAKEYHLSKSIIAYRLRQAGYNIENEHTKVKFNEHIFDTIDTEEKAYWLGFIYADGNVNKHKSSKMSYTLTIALKSTDCKHLEKFCDFIEYSKNNIKFINKQLNEKHYQQCRLEVCSRHLWETLNKLGVVPNKSLILEFPNESIFKDILLLKHFIRGYFDGDGCLSFYKRKYDIVPYCSYVGSENFIKNSTNYLPCNYTFRVRNYPNHNKLYEISVNIENSKILLGWLYNTASIYLDRKYNRYKLFKQHNFEIPYTEHQLEAVFETKI